MNNPTNLYSCHLITHHNNMLKLLLILLWRLKMMIDIEMRCKKLQKKETKQQSKAMPQKSF